MNPQNNSAPLVSRLRRDLGTVESYAALIGILIGAGIFKVTSQAWADPGGAGYGDSIRSLSFNATRPRTRRRGFAHFTHPGWVSYRLHWCVAQDHFLCWSRCLSFGRPRGLSNQTGWDKRDVPPAASPNRPAFLLRGPRCRGTLVWAYAGDDVRAQRTCHPDPDHTGAVCDPRRKLHAICHARLQRVCRQPIADFLCLCRL